MKSEFIEEIISPKMENFNRIDYDALLTTVQPPATSRQSLCENLRAEFDNSYSRKYRVHDFLPSSPPPWLRGDANANVELGGAPPALERKVLLPPVPGESFDQIEK